MNIYKTQKSILKEIVFVIKNNLILKNNVINIALVGSFQTKEAIKNYSDLDILFILKSDRFGEINPEVISSLKKMAERLNRHGIEISFLSHTVFEFRHYVDAEYLIHYSWGKVFYGSKKYFSGLFDKIIRAKNFNDKNRKRLIRYNIPHARFNLLRKYISWNDFSETGLRKLLKLYIDGTIEICEWILIYKKIFLKNKRDILKRFISECKDWENAELLSEIIETRKIMANMKINRKKTDLLIQKLTKLINYCNKKVYE